ncbi:hypothetical protein ONA70_10890 [Micromonospora yasonensis]|nr:hypothetical protein [Micromonospora yasonensis]MCW3840603.1 hypothetical protein [Micromonospora yasonensis]
MLVVHPVRDALVLQFSHDEPAGADHRPQPALVHEVEEAGQVALLVGTPGQVDRAVRQFVPQPRYVGGDGVAAAVAEPVEPVRPVGPVEPEGVHLAGE